MTSNIPSIPVETYDVKTWIRNTSTVVNRISSKLNDITRSGTLQISLSATIPDGWLSCNGQDVSRITYNDLFLEMGEPDTGDGSTTFTIPDINGLDIFSPLTGIAWIIKT